jgi:ASC-1-like (ASCH) protein
MANFYNSHRAEPYYTFLKKGLKTIEGRVKNGKYRLVKKGDHIVVHNSTETDSTEVIVERVAYYPSFEEMLKMEPIKKILPDVETVEDGIEVYRKFYMEKEEKKYGVVAIEVRAV